MVFLFLKSEKSKEEKLTGKKSKSTEIKNGHLDHYASIKHYNILVIVINNRMVNRWNTFVQTPHWTCHIVE